MRYFRCAKFHFFNSNLYYICQINNINKTLNYTFTPVHFFSFCCGQKEKKPNQRKEKHAVAWTRAIKDGYRFFRLANSPPAQTHSATITIVKHAFYFVIFIFISFRYLLLIFIMYNGKNLFLNFESRQPYFRAIARLLLAMQFFYENYLGQ